MIGKPFKFSIRWSVTLCAECEQKNLIEKPFKFSIRWIVMLCAECEQKNLIESPFKFSIRWNVTLCAECERYNTMNKAFVHLCKSHVAVLKWRVMRFEKLMKTEKQSDIEIEESLRETSEERRARFVKLIWYYLTLLSLTMSHLAYL